MDIVELGDPLAREEASDFVKAVMASDPVRQPVGEMSQCEKQTESVSNEHCNNNHERKRQRSDVGDNDSESQKRLKADSEPLGCDSMADLIQLVQSLSMEVKSLNVRVFERMDRMENTFARNVVENVSKMMDNKIKKEVGNLRAELAEEISEVKTNVNKAVNDCKNELERMKKSYAEVVKAASESHQVVRDKEDISLNIVIRNLPETANEQIASKVNKLFADGLQVRDVQVQSAERKQSRSDRVPGLVIAKCRSKADKGQILRKKASLKESRAYKDIFIHSDKSREDRNMEANLRNIAEAVGGDKLFVKGDRILKSGRNGGNYSNRRDGDSNTGRGDGPRGRR